MNRSMIVMAAAAIAAGLAACAQMPPATPAKVMRDGEVMPPADYRSWPKFLSAVQRPDNKQVREIYLNPVGQRAKAGDRFANGTVSVMELFTARVAADGAPLMGADGKLVKGDLLKIFVMAKGAGWGDSVAPPELKTGDWVFSAWQPDGKTATPDPITACRGCHVPLAARDFVLRYDEYFASRDK